MTREAGARAFRNKIASTSAISFQEMVLLLDLHPPMMAHVMNTADRGSPLLAVAAEIRQKIYGALFEGSELWLASATRNFKVSDNILELLKFIRNADTSVLKVCRTTLYEAQTVLAKETKLQVCYFQDRENPLDNMPDWFLSNISEVELEVDSFVHVQRGRLTNLQRVTLINEAPSEDSSLDALDMYDGMDDETFVKAVMDNILSWEWKKEQFIYLAEEEGWRLTLKTRWYSFMIGKTYLVCSKLL